MNNTDKSKLDAAKRMLKGNIDIEEVSAMFQISMDVLKPMKEEIDNEVRKVYGNVDAYDFHTGQVLYDNFNDQGNNEDIEKNV